MPADPTARPLVIHMGLQKTATTSLHHFLRLNRDALAGRLDLVTPRKKTIGRALGRTAMAFSLSPDAAHRAAFTDTVLRLRDGLLRGHLPCLVSHENLAGAMPGNSGVTALYPRLEAILDLLEAHLHPLRPAYVIYTREMQAWKRSVYNQAVRSDRYGGEEVAFLRETAQCGSWADLQHRLDRHLGPGRITFLRLEDETTPAYPGSQLLALAGLSPTEIAALAPLPGQRNPGLNAGALELVRRINTQNLPRPMRRRFVQLIRANQPLFRD